MRTRWIWFLVALAVCAGGWLVCAPEEPSVRLESPTAADLGLLLLEEQGQVVVLGVSEDSPAAEAGVVPGDRILSAADAALATVDELEALFPPGGGKVPLVVEQGGEQRVVELPVR